MREANAPAGLAVVGAAGFVGRELLRSLRALGIRATAVMRGLPELTMEGEFHTSRDPSATEGRFQTVINLAYPNAGSPIGHPARNDEIVRMVSGLVVDGGRLIHASTQAVFGITLDRPVHPGPVDPVRDVPYVESKIAAETAFRREQGARGLSLDIVRLGNVFGRASGAWGVPLVQRLLTGRPVGVGGRDGWSNATDIANVASYLVHLVREGDSRAGTRFHHLAEFSDVTWREWVSPIASTLGVDPVDADPSALQMPMSRRRELAAAVAAYKPRGLYRRVASERVIGSWSRSLLRSLPPSLFARAKGADLVFAAEPALDRDEQAFLAIMSCDQQFHSVVRADWRPPLSREESLAHLLDWLHRN